MREVNLHDGVVFLGEPFLRDILVFSSSSKRCLLFLCSYSVAKVKRISGCGISFYFLFDSHRINSRRLTNSQEDISVLIKFVNLYEIERYIERAYHVVNRSYPPCFQVQFISVNINCNDYLAIQSLQRNYFRRMKQQK